MSRVDYGFDQWSVVSYQETFCVFIYGGTVYILSYTGVFGVIFFTG